MIDVDHYCERWARWRALGTRFVGPSQPSVTLLGKIMDGMRSTTCPDCKGEGRCPAHKYGGIPGTFINPCPRCDGEGKVNGGLGAEHEHINERCPQCLKVDEHGELVATGEFAGVTCFVCRGTKRRIRHHKQVNPAGISGTRRSGINEDPDPISAAIDMLVASWMTQEDTVWLHLVIVREYAAGGTAEMKASKLGVSGAFFSKKLKDARSRIQTRLEDMGAL